MTRQEAIGLLTDHRVFLERAALDRFMPPPVREVSEKRAEALALLLEDCWNPERWRLPR